MKNRSDIIEALDARGICRLPGQLTDAECDDLLSLVQTLHEEAKAHKVVEPSAITDIGKAVWNLQSKDFRFVDLLFRDDVVMDVLRHQLNDSWYRALPENEPNFVLRSYLARSPTGAMPLHIDSFVPYTGDFPFVMQLGIVIEDHDERNGSFLIVPGSHKSGAYASQEALSDAEAVNPRKGDILIWDARLWHGCEENRSDGTRWMLIATFSRWWIKQLFNITGTMPQSIYGRLTDRQKAVMGFCSIPHDDERSGVNLKQGYDNLPSSLPT